MSRTSHRELSVPADTRYLASVRAAVLDVIGQSMFTPVKANLVALAVDEAVANIMEHAYDPKHAKTARKDVEVILDATPEAFRVIIRDHGASFDPREVPDVDVAEHAKAGHKGGLGIVLMKRIMDEIQYSYKNGEHNELLMIKYVDGTRRKTKSNIPPLRGA